MISNVRTVNPTKNLEFVKHSPDCAKVCKLNQVLQGVKKWGQREIATSSGSVARVPATKQHFYDQLVLSNRFQNASTFG